MTHSLTQFNPGPTGEEVNESAPAGGGVQCMSGLGVGYIPLAGLLFSDTKALISTVKLQDY